MACRGFQTELLDPPGGGADAQDRWVLSYADFITLMFAFFVVMYSVSSVNDGKFRVLSEHLLEVFNQPEVLAQLEAGLPETLPQGATDSVAALDAVLSRFDDESGPVEPLDAPAFEAALRQALARLGEPDEVRVTADADWTALEIASDSAFDGAAEQPGAETRQLLQELAGLLRGDARAIRIEAFTDNVAPSEGRWRNNWEKSAEQAAAIATVLIEAGVSAEFVSAAGFGERHAAGDNATAAGRSRNRRIVVAVARHAEAPSAVSSAAAANTEAARERLPARTLRRVDRLPGPVSIPR